jgi:Xaa-Pro aminopeptidase
MATSVVSFEAYHQVQSAAKSVLADIKQYIVPSSTERSIATKAVELLAACGLRDTWYYHCPALVLLGSRSCESISGRDYLPSEEPVRDVNLVTIDLSPCRNSIWGDCARSFFVEKGCVQANPESPEFSAGKQLLTKLHDEMKRFVTPSTTFHDLHEFACETVRQAGYENLDAHGNWGHSIAQRLQDRIYTTASNRIRLCDVPFFTFEPHVRKQHGIWGFKHEEIYFFNAAGAIGQL